MVTIQYQQEQQAFRQHFTFLKASPIALYGIGRRTATLLPVIRDFHIVALLDRSPENIGREIDGVPIRSLKDANKMVDAIIINSDPGNYHVIYERIADAVEVPVYFANGERATKRDASYAMNPYWNISLPMLLNAIASHDVISFDFFDTLITRKTMTPTDAFALLGKRVKETYHLDFDFATVRQSVAAYCSPFAQLDELYEKIAWKTGMSLEQARAIEESELLLEEELTVVRVPVAEAFRHAIQMGKQVVITSDTYLSRAQFQRLMSHHGLDVLPERQVLLSSEEQRGKADGNLFSVLKKRYPNASILHIGDNPESDIAQAEKHAIDAFYLMNPAGMLKSSSIGRSAVMAKDWRDDIRLGLLAAKLFQNPFALHTVKGKVPFNDAKTFGYSVFGGVLLRFFEWLATRAKRCHLKTLLFFARDGYFLERDFRHFLQLRGLPLDIRTEIVPISRQLIYLATMHSKEDFHRVASFAFLGTFQDYLYHRFNLRVDESDVHAEETIHAGENDALLMEWLRPYESRIWEEQSRQERNYRQLLKKRLGDFGQPAGIVDFSFYGTTQHYFQAFLHAEFRGFYFIADLSKQNPYHQEGTMEACFQSEMDPKAERCLLRKKGTFLESFLTAPYGMIRFVDDDGTVITEPDRENQKHFAVKERVNEGAREYMEDAVSLLPLESDNGANGIEAAVYHALLDGGAQVTADVLQGFYFDNDMVGSKEVPLEI